MYVDDIPSPENCLYGAFIYSTMPLARIKSIRFKENRVPEGVLGIVTYKDIPKGGQNVGNKGFFASDLSFAEEITHGAGEIIAFLVSLVKEYMVPLKNAFMKKKLLRLDSTCVMGRLQRVKSLQILQ